ncbi:MAG: MFS transporter [Alphaproteobacteria bacterium]|nr:MFS transporter [Alphaproteobacteria bacterium]
MNHRLWRGRNFAPLFVAQFLGALNDNLFKGLVGVMIAYRTVDIGDSDPALMIAFATALFILPFLLLNPLGGVLADRLDKAWVMRIIKIAEIGIIMLALVGLFTQRLEILFLVLMLLGVHSALFSPAKFSILPQHLPSQKLISANAWLNTGTYLAILGGTVLASAYGATDVGLFQAALVLSFCAVVGCSASFFIPWAPPSSQPHALSLNPLSAWLKNFSLLRGLERALVIPMIGASWFFFVGAVVLGQFPHFAHTILGADHQTLSIFMLLFMAGVMAGGLANPILLRGRISTVFAGPAAGVIALACLFVYALSLAYTPQQTLLPPAQFFAAGTGWALGVMMLALAFAAGVYIVPLKAYVQHHAPAHNRARIMAASGFLDALFILLSSAFTAATIALGFRVSDLFWMLALGSFAMAVVLIKRRGILE